MKTSSALTVDNNRCFACGTENEAGLKLQFSYSDDDREAETRFLPNMCYQGWKDLVHGGILMTLMDETMAKVRAAAGIEPATSRTRNENHTSRPSSRKYIVPAFWIVILNLKYFVIIFVICSICFIDFCLNCIIQF